MHSVQIPDYPLNNNYTDHHCFMPSYPICRSVPPFKADRLRVADGKACNKYSSKHPGLTPGILTVFCAHRKCLGFSLLTNPEGPSTVFDVIYTRSKTGELTSSLLHFVCILVSCLALLGFALHAAADGFGMAAAPKLIVNANACNLHKYVLRRAPNFFSNAAFRIDRQHIYNHEGYAGMTVVYV